MANQSGEGEPTEDGDLRIGRWDRDRVARIEATAPEPRGALLAGLRGIVALATGRDEPPAAADVTLAAPIQGSGADLASLFAALADDLLDQLTAFGGGFGRVRLDGLLRTDNGGWTAWGYLLGPAAAGDLVPLARRGEAAIEAGEGRIRIHCDFSRHD